MSWLVYQLLPNLGGRRAALLISVAVLSHWFLDLLVHRPDLPLYNDIYKVGLGLWNYPVIALLLEMGVLFTGLILYMRSTVTTSTLGKYGMVVFGASMAILQTLLFFGPPITGSSPGTATIAFASYLIFASIAAWLETQRTHLLHDGLV
jgi:hypothetical protein